MAFSYDTYWCKNPAARCEGCAIGVLETVAPDVGGQVLAIIDTFGLEDVVKEVKASETQFDATTFDQMVEATGSDIANHNGGDFSGFQLAKDAIKQIAQKHSVNIF